MQNPFVADKSDQYPGPHGEQEGRTPVFRQGQELQNLVRIGQSGYCDAKSEDQPGHERRQRLLCVYGHDSILPSEVATSMPTSTKVAVAAMDRTDKRPTPQMPWPLVQPLPILVP